MALFGGTQIPFLAQGDPTRLLWNLLEQQQQPTISLSLGSRPGPVFSAAIDSSFLPSFLVKESSFCYSTRIPQFAPENLILSYLLNNSCAYLVV